MCFSGIETIPMGLPCAIRSWRVLKIGCARLTYHWRTPKWSKYKYGTCAFISNDSYCTKKCNLNIEFSRKKLIQDGRPAGTGIFFALHFFKDAFLKAESVFFFQKILPSNFTNFCTFKNLFFQKKPKFWQILLFQSHSMANLLKFREKNSRSESVRLVVEHQTLSIGEHRVKKRPLWVDDFPSIFFHGLKIIELSIFDWEILHELWSSGLCHESLIFC